MIKSLHLEDYKCFTNQRIELNNITLFTGANAAGKSSIIQAMLLYQAGCSNKGIINVSQALGVQVGSPKAFIAQDSEGKGAFDFKISFDNAGIAFYVDKENGLDLRAIPDSEADEIEISYLNAERIGPRMAYRAGGEDKILPDGSNAAYLIEKADNKELKIPEILLLNPHISQKFSYQLEQWMSIVLGNMKLSVKVDNNKAETEILIKNELVQDFITPTQTGFGISYILPIVTAALWASTQQNQILLIENPEAHLHPAAQSKIGKFLALVAASGVQVIVETHSEHVVDGVRVQMTALEKTEDVYVHFLSQENGHVEIEQLTVNRYGELSDWPEYFFDQKQMDLRELIKMRLKNEGK